MKKPSNFKVKPKILISLLTLLCVVCLILSAIVPSFSKPFKFATGIMVVPLQEGVNRIGTWFTDKEELMKSVKKLKSENKKLNEKVDELTEENSLLAQSIKKWLLLLLEKTQVIILIFSQLIKVLLMEYRRV